MAYGDRWQLVPGKVRYSTYSDGTVLPSLEIDVLLNGQPHGYVEVHLHRVKHPPHASVGVTSRVGPMEDRG